MWLRISAIVMRFFFLHRRSVARVMEIFFWPVMNLLVWGFVTSFLQELALPKTVLFLIGSVILWDVLYRSQQGITLAITEEFWVKNIINIFISPISVAELLGAICIVGIIKSLVTTIFLALLAFFLYSFNLMETGPGLVLFLGNLLLFGWAVGLFTMALIFRYGRAGEALIWGVPFLIQPVSAVFYPVGVLPLWLQKVAWLLPSTYVFEGMRQVLATGVTDMFKLGVSFGLNMVYLLLGSLYFGWMLRRVREMGYLSRMHLE
ncbi:MAG: ABC transporter permease [Deltaproteobacteria bacterium]|jgi:ABC-2 type transport system permease protein|nr:ABC transporter permease [Deltaproteobacteria bacterium]MBW2521775.1 ABC transporter permease [Deltaproteobacteria bacterium]